MFIKANLFIVLFKIILFYPWFAENTLLPVKNLKRVKDAEVY